jgi:hypothetical protein
VVGTLLVVNVAVVINAKLATDSAARQAIRDFVEEDVPAAGSTAEAERRAVASARSALDAEGLDPDKAEVTLLPLEGVGGQEGFTRCARVTFEVRYHVPAFTVPWVGGFGDGFDVRSRHSELIDPFRSGVPGTADGCGSV